MTDSKSSFEKLNDNNYASWKVQIQAYLNIKKLWLDIDVNEAIPEEKADIVRLAYFHIVSKVDSRNVRYIEDRAADNSVKALQVLRDKYEGTGILAKIQTLKYCLEFCHSSGIDSLIDELREKYNLLTNKGLALPEIHQVANLMISIPPDYGVIMSSFYNNDAGH